MSVTTINIRSAILADAADIARLSAMFGYDADVSAHTERLAQLLSRPEHFVWIAEDNGRIVGWLHAMLRLSLESPSHAEIAGLVVDEHERSRGIGALLVHAAEQWALAHGHREMRVRSNVIRERAHAFYRRRGYQALKQQQVFGKTLRVD